MTIELGWWALPAAITAVWVIYGTMPSRAPTGFSSLGSDLIEGLHLMIGLIIVLASWLVWALLA